MNENSRELAHKLARLDGLLRRSFGRAGHGGAHNPHRGQGRVLSILKLQPEMSQRELGYLLDMRKQSLGELLAKLEARGLIARTPSEEDRRAMMIRLTEEGRQAAEQLEQKADEGSDLFAALNEDEQKQLGEYLDRLTAALEQQLGDAGEQHGHECGHGHRGGPVHGAARFAEGFMDGPHGRHPGDFGPHGGMHGQPGFGPGCGRGRGGRGGCRHAEGHGHKHGMGQEADGQEAPAGQPGNKDDGQE